MLCYRCGGLVKDDATMCPGCGQRVESAAGQGFGSGLRGKRRALEGAPCQAGDVVAGRYHVREHAGAGPLGWVYRADDAETGEVVALKLLSPRFLQLPEEQRAFHDQLRNATRLLHRNIASARAAGDDGGRPWVVSPFLEAPTLRRTIELRREAGQPFTPFEVESVVLQIAAALEAAAPIFAHGNLKPDNVFVLADALKLTDFGLAICLPRAPFMAAQRAAGVHRFLAPEFLQGEPLDARSDVFSLGVMARELLAWSAPLAPGVDAVVRRATATRREERFATAGLLAAELGAVLAGPAPARPPRVEDVGDVLIVEAVTDPRVRIARALGAEPVQPSSDPAPEPRARLPRADIAAIRELPLPPPATPAPFTPPPFMPSASAAEPVAEPVSAEPVAPVAAAAPDLLSAETAVRAAPTRPEAPPSQPPRRGAGRRGRDHLRSRRSMPPPATQPDWPSTAPTEAAVAIGPTTPALEPITPDVAPIAETPPPALREPPSFVGLTEAPRSRLPLYLAGAAGAIAAVVFGASLLREKPAPAPVEEKEKAPAVRAAEAAPAAPAIAAAPPGATPQRKIVEPKADPVPAHAMSDRIRELREETRRALEQRERLRTHAAQRKAPEPSNTAAPTKVEPPARKEIAAPAADAAPVNAASLPPAGAIRGGDDDVLLASKGRKPAPPAPPAEAPSRVVAASFTAGAAAPAAAKLTCPPGMVAVPRGPALVGAEEKDDLRAASDRPQTRVELQGYCIDAYEFPNAAGAEPRVFTSFVEANDLCQGSGKRLCSEDEWEKACRGPADLRFPYGNSFESDACNTAETSSGNRKPVAAGAFAKCRSGYGVFDMSGNAAEWTATAFEGGDDRTVKGGSAARPSSDDRCASRRKLGQRVHDAKVGFRCCADAK